MRQAEERAIGKIPSSPDRLIRDGEAAPHIIVLPDNLPEPKPCFISLKDDGFIVDPTHEDGVDWSRSDKLLAMTPTERLRWHQAWRQFLRAAEQRGEDIQLLVYGKPSR
jgi:hypothetical protein